MCPRGRLLRVSTGQVARHGGGGKRGTVSGFSRQSRRRFDAFLATLDTSEHPLLVTLTYSGAGLLALREPDDWKRHFAAWNARMGRAFPDTGAVWVCEPTQAGVPHFHLLVYGADEQAFRSKASEAWHAIAGAGDKAHALYGSHVVLARDPVAVQVYCASRLKATGAGWKAMQRLFPAGTGRPWGTIRRARLPIAPKVEAVLTMGAATKVIRAMRRLRSAARRARGLPRLRSHYLPALTDTRLPPYRFEALVGYYGGTFGHDAAQTKHVPTSTNTLPA